MNEKIAVEIQAEQDHGHRKYKGKIESGSDVWYDCLLDFSQKAFHATPMEQRQYLIKLTGIAVTRIETLDQAKI